jgi:cyanophycinase
MGRDRGFIVPIGGAEEKRHGSILKRFVEICGGSSARIAVIPTASQDPESGPRHEKFFMEIGVRKARSFPLETRAAFQDKEWVRKLENADGLFMTGGNQLRLSTTMGGTAFSAAVRRRNAEGMHVAGTSAGAAFLSEHMIAYGDEGCTPRASMVTLAPGLGLTGRIIVDQHFTQRDRLGRLLTAISYNPKTIGVGVDEDTAAFIGPDDVLEVLGSGAVTIVDPAGMEFSSMDSAERDRPVSIIGVRLHILAAGGRFDIVNRAAQPAPALAGKH